MRSVELACRRVARHPGDPPDQRLASLDHRRVVDVAQHLVDRAPQEVDDRLVHTLGDGLLHGRVAQDLGQAFSSLRLDRVQDLVDGVLRHHDPRHDTLMELQITEETMQEVVNRGLEAGPGLRVLQEAPEAFGREGQVARDRLLDGSHEPEWKDLLERPPGLQQLGRAALEVVRDRGAEFLALDGVLKPLFHGGLERRSACRRQNATDRLIRDCVDQVGSAASHRLLELLGRDVCLQLVEPALERLDDERVDVLLHSLRNQLP